MDMNNQYIRNIIGEKFIKFVKENPNKYWNWHGISQNPNITWDIIKSNIDKPWFWPFISKHQIHY